MNCTVDGKEVTVTVSRRNLLALLSKLDYMGDSALTITRETDSGWKVVLRAEHDEQHYEGRTPGKMHPMTEVCLQRIGEE